MFLNQLLKWLVMGNFKFLVQETKPRIFETFKSPELPPSLLSRFWPPHRETEGIIPLLQMTNQTCWLQNSSSHLPLKIFRFENEKDYKGEYSKKNRHARRLHFVLFSTRKVNRVMLLKEVEPSSDRKMIQLLTFDDLFPPLRHSRYTVVLERQCLSRFPAKMTLVHSRARTKYWNNLVLSPCLGESIRSLFSLKSTVIREEKCDVRLPL